MAASPDESVTHAPYRGRARVTMTWETAADFVDSEGGGIRCTGWVHDAEGLLERVLSESPKTVSIERLNP